MKRIGTTGLFALASLAAFASLAFATPNPSMAVVKTRIFNDCPSSTVSSTNTYPSSISITDADNFCFGFANLHDWLLSDDGVNPTGFPNNSAFSLECDFMLDGTGNGEGGLHLGPWWSPDVDGVLNLRTTDGEIACFGGRLPFYSFTGAYGLHYVKGTTVHLKLEYHQNGLSALTPATIEYSIVIGGTPYTSGRLNFDMGNPAEDPPHGLWGNTNDGFAGGSYKIFLPNLDPAPQAYDLTATWSNIGYTNLDSQPVPAKTSTWGRLKTLYR